MRLLEFYTLPNSLRIPLDGSTRARHTADAGIAHRWIMAFVLTDIVALGLAAILASLFTAGLWHFVLRDYGHGIMEGASPVRLPIMAALGLGAIAMFGGKGLYTKRMPWWTQVRHISKAVFFLFLIDGFISFALKHPESRLLILSTWVCALPLLVSLRWIMFQLASRRQSWKIPTVFIGDSVTATDLIYAFSNDPCVGYDIHTVFLRDHDAAGFDRGSLPSSCSHINVRSGAFKYESYINTHPEFFYVVAPDTFRGETKENLIKALREAGAAYAIVPSTVGMGVYDMEPRYFFGHDLMMLQPRNSGFSAAGKIIKRAMDIVIAGTALLVLAPLFGIVAGMLKLEGQGGSVFYGGKRIGYEGRYFSCWKFRSMEPDSDDLLYAYLDADPEARENWEKYRKLPKDPRVTTRTARFIRKASIDELPQLWNVLTGDMSLIGPRPILEDEKSYFTPGALREYMSVRPGLTGLWQVSGRNTTTFARRIHWDRWYIRNWSLWGDIVILVKTPLVLLTGKGAH